MTGSISEIVWKNILNTVIWIKILAPSIMVIFEFWCRIGEQNKNEFF